MARDQGRMKVRTPGNAGGLCQIVLAARPRVEGLRGESPQLCLRVTKGSRLYGGHTQRERERELHGMRLWEARVELASML